MNIQKIDINLLKPAEYNPRKKLKKTDKEYIKIKNSIEKFGYIDPIILNKDFTVIGGHQRLTVLKDLKYKEIDCVIVDISKEEEKALNIGLNKISGEWDKDLLKDLFLDLKLTDIDLNLTGFDDVEISELIGEELKAEEESDKSESALKTYISMTYTKGKYRTKGLEHFSLFRNNEMDLEKLKKDIKNTEIFVGPLLNFIKENNIDNIIIPPPGDRTKENGFHFIDVVVSCVSALSGISIDRPFVNTNNRIKLKDGFNKEYDKAVVVDDIITRGNTMSACKRNLKFKELVLITLITNH